MKKKDVIQYFGSVRAVADALKIRGAAVSQWGERVPVRRAYELEKLTDGVLKATPEMDGQQAA